MADYENTGYRTRPAGADAGVIDQGLRSYMLRVYNYMVLAMMVTGFTAYVVFALAFTTDAAAGVARVNSVQYLTQFGAVLFTPPIVYGIIFAPLAFSIFLSWKMGSVRWQTAFSLLMAFSVVMGLSMASIFAVYVGADIIRVFFITAIAFGGLSLFGYTTKMDLSPFRSFLIMGVWGLIAASLVNFFLLESSTLDLAISVIGVLLFAGITAFQTQELKQIYYATGGVGEIASRAAVGGAYVLYLSFINMFMFLLNLLGNRQE
jgi:FtsH-binding integral membrane protein